MKQINENVIRNCTFSDNIAKRGGAIHISGKITLIDCVFVANKAVMYGEQSTNSWSGNVMGGAFYIGSFGRKSTNQLKATFTRCTFINNEVINREDPSSAFGGAIRVGGSSIIVSGCNFYNNTAALGGAVSVQRKGDITITTSQFLSNRAETGGAVAIITQSQTRGSLTIDNVKFINNSALYGGAVHIAKRFGGKVSKGRKMIENCIFINNTATTIGQSVFTNSATHIRNTFLEAFESTNTFHLHSEAGSGMTSIRNTTLHLHRNKNSRGMKSNALYISASYITVSSSLKVKCPKGFNVGERNSSYKPNAFQKKFTLLTLYCDACPYNTYSLRYSSYHLLLMVPGQTKVFNHYLKIILHMF